MWNLVWQEWRNWNSVWAEDEAERLFLWSLPQTPPSVFLVQSSESLFARVFLTLLSRSMQLFSSTRSSFFLKEQRGDVKTCGHFWKAAALFVPWTSKAKLWNGVSLSSWYRSSCCVADKQTCHAEKGVLELETRVLLSSIGSILYIRSHKSSLVSCKSSFVFVSTVKSDINQRSLTAHKSSTVFPSTSLLKGQGIVTVSKFIVKGKSSLLIWWFWTLH